MPQRTVRVADPAGLHARPAASLVRVAAALDADIRIRHRDREANAKSIVDVLTLDVGQGADVTIVTEGADAAAALERIASLLSGEPALSG
jgi:phosphocarrier protein HPr